MNSITQAEFDKQFAEYVKGKEVNRDNLLKLLLQYEKILKEQDITVRPGYHINEVGERVDE